jgi:hypothetical protein
MSQIYHNNSLTKSNIRHETQSSTELALEGSFLEVPWWRVLT